MVRHLGKKININYYLKSVVILYMHFINYDNKYQPLSETVLEALKQLKDSKKVDGDKADENEMDENEVNKDKVNEDKLDEDEVLKIRDALA